MNDVVIQFEPLGQWPRPKFTAYHKRSPFKSDWNRTMQLLRYELGRLDVENGVLRIHVDRYWIRADGSLRSGTNPNSPAVVLNFAAPNTGPVVIPCDTFDNWRHNVHAIALALEALRAVDRYGVTSRAEQYRGWAALPAPPQPDFDDDDDARAFLANFLGLDKRAIEGRETIEAAVRMAEKKSHPDAGGKADDFKKVQSARKLLLR